MYKNQKGAILPILVVILLLGGIIATTQLSKIQQIFKPKATESAINFKTPEGSPLPKDSAGVDVTTSRTIKIQLTAPVAPTPTPQGFRLVKEVFAAHAICPAGTTHVGPETYSCGYSTSSWARGQCANGGSFQRSACSDGSNVHYSACVCNAPAATPTPAPTPPTSQPVNVCGQTCSSFTSTDSRVRSPSDCQTLDPHYVGVIIGNNGGVCTISCGDCRTNRTGRTLGRGCDCVSECTIGNRYDYDQSRCIPDPTASPSPSPSASATPLASSAVTVSSYILTDSPANPVNPVVSDPNVKFGAFTNTKTTIDSYTLTRTDPGEAFIFVKFIYSNGQSQVINKRLKYDPSFGVSPSPSPTASAQASSTPQPTASAQATAAPSSTPYPTPTPYASAAVLPTPDPVVVGGQNTSQFPIIPFTPNSFTSENTSDQENLLVNGNFEEVLSAQTQCSPGGTTGSCERDFLEKKNGDYSMKVEYSGGSFGNQFEWNNINVSSGEEVCLSYWIKRSSLFTALLDKPMAAIQSGNASPDNFFEALYPSALTTNWQFVQNTIKIPNDWSTPVKVFLRSRFRFGGDTNWFDDVSLKRSAC